MSYWTSCPNALFFRLGSCGQDMLSDLPKGGTPRVLIPIQCSFHHTYLFLVLLFCYLRKLNKGCGNILQMTNIVFFCFPLWTIYLIFLYISHPEEHFQTTFAILLLCFLLPFNSISIYLLNNLVRQTSEQGIIINKVNAMVG